MNQPNPEPAGEGARIERQVNRLVDERSALFDKAGASHGLSNVDQQRLGMIERELDECFVARRRLRADRDAQRFDRDRPFIRRQLPPKATP
jgi:hypothetical protein